MRELYALLVGEAGIDPRYFMHEMTAHEAADFLEGYRRRSRDAWERSRVGWYVATAHEGKSMEEIFPFAWDKKEPAAKLTKRTRDALRQKAAALAQQFKKTNGTE